MCVYKPWFMIYSNFNTSVLYLAVLPFYRFIFKLYYLTEDLHCIKSRLVRVFIQSISLTTNGKIFICFHKFKLLVLFIDERFTAVLCLSYPWLEFSLWTDFESYFANILFLLENYQFYNYAELLINFLMYIVMLSKLGTTLSTLFWAVWPKMFNRRLKYDEGVRLCHRQIRSFPSALSVCSTWFMTLF